MKNFLLETMDKPSGYILVLIGAMILVARRQTTWVAKLTSPLIAGAFGVGLSEPLSFWSGWDERVCVAVVTVCGLYIAELAISIVEDRSLMVETAKAVLTKWVGGQK